MELLQIVYVSSATKLLEPRELRELLRGARARNRAAGITGLLLYHEGNFIQVIEGPPDAARALERRIAGDPRHHGMLVLLRRPLPEREFGDHSLGLARLDPVQLGEGEEGSEDEACEGLLELFEPGSLRDAIESAATPAKKLLRSFAQLLR